MSSHLHPHPHPHPRQQYQNRRDTFSADLAAARKASAVLSNVRLAVFLAATGGFLALILGSAALPALALLALGTLAFAVLVVRHGKVLMRERLAAALVSANEAGIRRLDGHWREFPVDGREFADERHAFTSDLDLFGRASLFQWLNAAQTRFGREALARLLASTPRDPETLRADQAAVAELGSRLDWRQRFQAAGRFLPVPGGREDPESLIAWAGDHTPLFESPGLAFAFRLLPILTWPLGLFGFLASGSWVPLLVPALLHLAIAARVHRRHGPTLEAVLRHRQNLEAYLELLVLLETGGFSDPALQAAVAALRNPAGLPASAAVRRLQAMADWMETRSNAILQFLLNALCLWDLQWLWAFRRWRDGNGESLRSWLETIARMEVLASLANIPFENPDWAFPAVGEGREGPILEAQSMGHPLLDPGIRVRNDLRIGRAGEALLITGSNMSGKSTLLRTAGINLALAYAGAPVCAAAFRCAVLDIHTSMRLKDDLEKRISSFYAELLRLKALVEAARAGRKVLFLVDEIFRGTNSKDRHEGAEAVLRQLRDLGAAGLVSTHDLELARLEAEDPEHFRNFHFEEHFDRGRIAFDFRLRPGVSTTTNAIHLLRMVGLGSSGGVPAGS